MEANEAPGGFFGANSAQYASLTASRPEFRERYALLGRLIQEHAGVSGGTPRCVDLGCGTGVLARHAASLGYETLGIDGSGAMVSAAVKETPPELDSRVRYRRLRLPLSEVELEPLKHKFELAVLSSVIEYVEDDLAVLDQCGEMLVVGGVLIASFPNRRSVYRRLERRLRKPLGRAGSYLSVQLHTYDADEIAAALTARGLKVRETRYFALPLQRVLGAAIRRRPRWLATMFVIAAEKRDVAPSHG
jgi:2-polyprenyl-3-methyl-5-hydroxy-6-metoxy-1,4-benzoquinol methylase